ncbi:MAG: hypothetical protein AVDCRST_MAG37-2580, partial [uncultured Rubrobacteraceae bacterium]
VSHRILLPLSRRSAHGAVAVEDALDPSAFDAQSDGKVRDFPGKIARL